MKALFIGEGAHEIGHRDVHPNVPQPARGVLPTLVRRICPQVAPDSIALRWAEIARFHPSGKKHGYEAKLTAAMLLSDRRFRCAATVCVADHDGDDERLPAMQQGSERGRPLVRDTHAVACGVAVASIEAWTLGAPSAIADALRLEVREVQNAYPVHRVEELSERSGRPENRPKGILARLAALVHQGDCTGLRQAIADLTDIAELEKNCPKGFKPFATALRATLGSRS